MKQCIHLTPLPSRLVGWRWLELVGAVWLVGWLVGKPTGVSGVVFLFFSHLPIQFFAFLGVKNTCFFGFFAFSPFLEEGGRLGRWLAAWTPSKKGEKSKKGKKTCVFTAKNAKN